MGYRAPGKHKRAVRLAGAIIAFMVGYPALYAQEPPAERAPIVQNAGEAEVALQGYYLGGSGQALVDTSGTALSFREFIGGFGLLSGSLQAYGSQGSVQMGENFLDLQKVAAFGQHWRFTGGDFRIASNMVDNPFNNVYNPEIAGRGFRMEVSRDKRTFGFFVGEETLQEGPRITFRVQAPQTVFGTFTQQEIGDHLQIGVRTLHFGSSESQIQNNPFLFPAGRQFLSANTLQTQATYSFNKQFKFYSEGTLSFAQEASASANAGSPASVLLGPAWESANLTLRSNYTYQTASYFPLLGYFAGDRKGEFAEARYRLTPGIEISASANHYSNNLANDPDVSDFHTTGYSAGTSLTLPWKLSAGANVSIIQFLASPAVSSQQDVSADVPQGNSTDQQVILSLSRAIQRHNLRFSFMDLKLDSNLTSETQKSMEIEDTFLIKKIVLGGAIRTQSADSTQSRSTLYFRGSAQVNFHGVSAYGYMETGNDLLNRTLFAANSYSSTVVGLSAPVTRGWNFQAEVFRNQLNTSLNPENIFVMQSQGIGISNTLSAFNQWSTYFRLAKRMHWGADQSGGWEHYAAIHNPLVGVVDGVVAEQIMAGNRGVGGIPVSLDGARVTTTQADGRYRFIDVPEGFHRVDLDMQALPADFETGTAVEEHVKVEPRSSVRADLNVFRLTSVSGKVTAPSGMALDDVVIRLSPSRRYTTPDADGTFTFYNLREGDYELVVDEKTLPEGSLLLSQARASIAVRLDSAADSTLFEIGIRKVEKPVRIVIEQTIDLNGSAKKTTRGGSPKQ